MKRIGAKVDYFGLELWITLPYVAVDQNGVTSIFSDEPEINYHHGFWDDRPTKESMLLTELDLEGKDWTTTLKHYDLETGKEL